MESASRPLTDTSRDELRARIAVARDRFDELLRSSDSSARPPRSEWTVQGVAAHVLTVAHRYREVAEGRAFPTAGVPRDLDALNQQELERVVAPLPELADQLRALEPVLDEYFDRTYDDPAAFPFHFDVTVPGLSAQTNYLGEWLLHGEDIALAQRRPWPLEERDMLLVLSGSTPMVPSYAKPDLPEDTDLTVAYRIPGARPYVIAVRGRTAVMRERRADDRPDVVMRGPASVLVQSQYGRITPLQATRRGLFVVGGRRPWKVLAFASMFERV